MRTPVLPAILMLAAAAVPAADLLGDAPPTRPPPEPRAEAADGDSATGRMATAGLRRLVEQGKSSVRLFNEDKTRNATAIVDAAIDFGKARKLAEGSDNPELIADIQANLFWCKKQMDVDALKDYLARKGEDAKVGLAQMDAVAAMKPDPAEAKAYLDRAAAFASANPEDRLQQAVRFLEVAERFPSTAEGTEANKRALAAQEGMMKAAAEAAAAARATRFTRPSPAAAGHLAVPDANAQKDAMAALKKTYAKDYAKREPKDKRRFARKLFDDAPNNKGDAAVIYVELNEAVRLAGECEDYIRLLDACDRLAATFQGYDAAAEKQAALKRVSSKPVAAAILKLLDSPEDAAANLAAGKWFAFSARRWPESLTMLIRSGDPALAKVAQMELDKPAGPEEQAQVADAWYDLGKKASAHEDRNGMLGRAQSWYIQAAAGLSGLAKDRVAQRMAEIEKQLPLDLDHIDWNALTASQWDKLKGTVVTVNAKHERSETGTVLAAGQKMRVVPNPADTWTFLLAYNQEKVVSNWRGRDPGHRSGDSFSYYYAGIAGQPYGAMLAWLDTGEKKLAGVVTGPGRLWLGPSTDRSWENDSQGAIRCKLIPADDDD